MTSQADRLRELLKSETTHIVPSCFDALSARMIDRAGFDIAFMSGFAVSASRIAEPDAGLMSYGEVVDQGRNICSAVSIPMIGDGDTGFGNALNVRRTVEGFARAGFASIMIEDQLSPKRCGHTRGKDVVSREEAFDRIKAAVDARDEGTDILILARTDARHSYGLPEAIERAQTFAELGADITFVESPRSTDEMRTICREIDKPQMANMVEGGDTPILTQDELTDIGFAFAAFPLTLMSAAMLAMQEALTSLKFGKPHTDIMDFMELRDIVGFNRYYEMEARYSAARDRSEAAE